MDLIKNDVINWGIAYLSSHGYQLKNSIPENVQIRPWSYVIRFDTSEGFIYLKQTPKLIALEAEITKILHNQFHAPVPDIIASNSELCCFLMKDAGNPLRSILKKQFDTTLLCKAVDSFTRMQLSVSDKIDSFIKIGVPDFRLNKLPGLYETLLSKKDILISNGLTEKEIIECKSIIPAVSDLCKKLSQYNISETLVQPDFHDNNALIDGSLQRITIIDLGEIVISHPFFSLINFLDQIKKHHGLTKNDSAYQEIQDACFKNFLQFESHENLLKVFELVRILLPIYGALAHYRLIEACDKAELVSFYGAGKLRDQLKEFATACRKQGSIMSNKLLSHSIHPETLQNTVEKTKNRIISQGDLPYTTVEKQLDLLNQLTQFEFGRFLLQNQGLNGYWTHYALTYPWFRNEIGMIPELEKWMLEKAPVLLATQQRFEIFLNENQKAVKNNAVLACIPCGMMGELLYLNYDNINNIKLVGIDYDANTVHDAKSLADKNGLSKYTDFIQSNAWDLEINNKFDLISSNGLNLYEPNDEKVTQLYQKFYNALKPGGKLIASFLTLPPSMTDQCEWNMSEINQDDLLLQKIIFADIIQSKWQCYRSTEKTQEQLQSVGFKNIKFIADRANVFPTVIAFK